MAKIEQHIIEYLNNIDHRRASCWHIAKSLGPHRKHLETVKRAAKRLQEKGKAVLYYDELQVHGKTWTRGGFGCTQVLCVALPGAVDGWKTGYPKESTKANLCNLITAALRDKSDWINYSWLVNEVAHRTGNTLKRNVFELVQLGYRPRNTYQVEPKFYVSMKRAISKMIEAGTIDHLSDYHRTKGIKITHVRLNPAPRLDPCDRGADEAGRHTPPQGGL